MKFLLDERERRLIEPVLERAKRLQLAHQEAVEELLRLLSMATGIEPELLEFDPQAFVVSRREPSP